MWWMFAILASPVSVQAQDNAGESTNPARTTREASEVIDILIERPEGEIDPRLVEECERQDDAARISGEIVVCRELTDRSERYYSDREAAERRYAEETAFRDAPATPDPCGPNCGIFKGEPTIGSMCIPGLQKCPPPPALIIDVTALPEAPPGSDADRIARGLPPIGNDKGSVTGAPANPGVLGLPPAPADREETVSRAESAEPEAER
ncbi:hypothetical protein [Altererythrobacter sp.]|uniref:hypothetical protein n=1 Tax=Altererythrobacter sp. TaxID=1872480 RepID=UPI003CFC6A1B